MALELLFNGGLALFFIYCFFYVGSTAPDHQPGTVDGAQWPQGLLILLIIFLIANVVKIYRKTPKSERNLGAIKSINFKGLYKNKLLLGSLLLVAYAFLLDYLGFILGTFLFTAAYSKLLGEKRIGRLLLISLIIVVVLYVLFQKGLDIMLPRGVGILRDIALMLE